MPKRPFSASLEETLKTAKKKDASRDLDVLELWSGVGSIAAAALEKKFTAETMELNNGQDLSTKEGFAEAQNKVLRLGEGGLLWMGLPCSSFVFLNSSNCKRNLYNGYKGDTNYPPVKLGNLFANEAKFLAELAFKRNVQVVIENPPSSCLWSYYPEKFMNELGCTAVVYRCRFDDSAPPGNKLWKQYKFAGTDPWVCRLHLGCDCNNTHSKLTYKDKNGGVCGNQALLTDSAAYPKRLGRAVIEAWMTQEVEPNKRENGNKRLWQSLAAPGPSNKSKRSWQTLWGLGLWF